MARHYQKFAKIIFQKLPLRQVRGEINGFRGPSNSTNDRGVSDRNSLRGIVGFRNGRRYLRSGRSRSRWGTASASRDARSQQVGNQYPTPVTTSPGTRCTLSVLPRRWCLTGHETVSRRYVREIRWSLTRKRTAGRESSRGVASCRRESKAELAWHVISLRRRCRRSCRRKRPRMSSLRRSFNRVRRARKKLMQPEILSGVHEKRTLHQRNLLTVFKIGAHLPDSTTILLKL